jgi:hypothetical protein
VNRDAVLAAAREKFIVEQLVDGAKDVGKLFGALGESAVAHQPTYVLVFKGDSDAWKLTLAPDVSLLAEGVAQHRQLQKSEPVVLDGLLLQRVLKGAQITTETDAAKAIGSGAELVVLVRPVTMDEIVRVADLELLLPAHSTALHPPIAPNLLGFVVDPDEDLV